VLLRGRLFNLQSVSNYPMPGCYRRLYIHRCKNRKGKGPGSINGSCSKIRMEMAYRRLGEPGANGFSVYLDLNHTEWRWWRSQGEYRWRRRISLPRTLRRVRTLYAKSQRITAADARRMHYTGLWRRGFERKWQKISAITKIRNRLSNKSS